ncbi:MAG: stage III sporulation protein AF [Tuberibacillus sp.]
MSVVYNWIAQIILLIMLATVLEMLLPNDSFKRYVKMVIGLVLIVALLSPVMKLFSMPVDEILRSINPPPQEDPIKKSLNNNKKVIESNIHSYIQQQTAVQMKNYVQKELIDRYHLTINQLEPEIDPESSESPVKSVKVWLGQAKTKSDKPESSVKPVEEVTVDVANQKASKVSENKQAAENKQYEKVRKFLSEKWGLASDKISIQMEGGDT